jgi:nitrous oxidase accessory protein
MVTTGSSGGALYLTYTKASEIWNNRFSRSPGNDGYGIKGREARDTRIHHNTIQTDFAIEFPFENDWTVEVDHNYLGGTMSIPKFSGGSFPDGGYTFHVHHNYFKTSYSFEYHRNAMEIDHNLFDFSTQSDGGNLVSGFDVNPAKGGTKMHDNLISNPGRGLYWNEGVYNGFSFTNNHVKAQTTVTPRTEGLFDFRPTAMAATTDWSTIVIRDNVFELVGTSRPLMRNAASYAAVIENNTLTNVKDVASYANKDTGKPRGPTDRLSFRLGAEEEWTIDEWTISRTPSGSGVDGGAALGGAGGRGGAAGAQVDGGAPTAGAPAGGGGAGGAITGRGGASGSAGAQAGASGGSEAGDARGGGGCNASGSDAASGSAVLLGLAALIVRRRARRS